MSNEIEAVVREEIVGGTDHIAITPYGVEFDDDHKPSITEWLEVVNKVQKVHGMMQFYLGDLTVFAESPVTGYGESKYDDLVQATGYKNEALRRFASVARRFPISFRKSVLDNGEARSDVATRISYNHFQEVAPLDDEHAQYFLEKVAEGRWTVAKLREEVAKLRDRNVIETEVDEEGTYIPTFNEAFKDLASWAVS